MLFITLTLYATIHLNMTSAIKKDLGGIKNPSSFEIKASKELESLGLFIFKDKKNNQIIEISGNKNKNIRDSHLKFIGSLKEITDLSLEETHITEEGIRYYLEWYARLHLGRKIYKCIEKQGDCDFEAEL